MLSDESSKPRPQSSMGSCKLPSQVPVDSAGATENGRQDSTEKENRHELYCLRSVPLFKSRDGDDGTENNRFNERKQCLQVRFTLWYICLPFSENNNVK